MFIEDLFIIGKNFNLYTFQKKKRSQCIGVSQLCRLQCSHWKQYLKEWKSINTSRQEKKKTKTKKLQNYSLTTNPFTQQISLEQVPGIVMEP